MDDYTKTFAYEIQTFLEITAMNRCDLAYELQVSPSTISRWASGEAVPHPKIQEVVLKTMESISERI